jgi:hypothetical protein
MLVRTEKFNRVWLFMCAPSHQSELEFLLRVVFSAGEGRGSHHCFRHTKSEVAALSDSDARSVFC